MILGFATQTKARLGMKKGLNAEAAISLERVDFLRVLNDLLKMVDREFSGELVVKYDS